MHDFMLARISHKFVRNAPYGLRRAPDKPGLAQDSLSARRRVNLEQECFWHRAETYDATRCVVGGFLTALPGS